MRRLGRPTQRQRQAHHKFYVKTKQVKPASKIENPTGVGCRLLRPWVFSVGQRRARTPTSFLGQRSVMESRAPTEVETWDAKDLQRKQKTKKSKTLDTEPSNLWSPTWDNSRFRGSAVKSVTSDMVKTQDAMWPGNRSFELTRRDFEEIVREDPDRSV